MDVNAICCFGFFFFFPKIYVMHLLFYMHFLVQCKRLEDNISEVYGDYFVALFLFFGVPLASVSSQGKWRN